MAFVAYEKGETYQTVIMDDNFRTSWEDACMCPRTVSA
jgi:hypothetical protein